MHYKTVSFLGEKYKFVRGLNVLSLDDSVFFDNLSLPLMAISNLFDRDFPSSRYFYENIVDSMNVVFSHENNILEEVVFDFCRNGSARKNWLDKNDLKEKIIANNLQKPILAYYKSGNCAVQENYKSKYQNHIIKEDEWFPWREWKTEFNFFASLAIDTKYNNKNEFSVCHYENIKNMVEEFLNIFYLDTFDFSIENGGKFTFFNNNSKCCNVDTEYNEIGITVGMLMQLYLGCLQRKPHNFIGNPCDVSGIVICNYNFGERPSYSDKKWECYNLFTKYFPKMQFIVC